MLTFEFDSGAETLLVHGDPAGLRALMSVLGKLVEHTPDGEFDHEHLKTPEWGGAELSGDPQSDGAKIIHHVKLYCWKR